MANKVLEVVAGAADRPLQIGDIGIPCYVLEDETRVLVQRGMAAGMGMSHSRGQRLTTFVASKTLKPFISNDLRVVIASPIKFVSPGGVAHGYPATILTDLCDAVLAARDADALQKQQLHIAAQCEILVRGLARVGIIALVDEVTGYQDIRARNSLAKILEEFIAKELQPWTKTFPDDFYKEMFRLREWPWQPWNVKRPSVVGKYTNDLVYERIAPGVLEELRRKNPKLPQGTRKRRHFQWFTPNFGHPKLKEHLASVIALMRASSNWPQFMRNMNRALPKLNETIEMPFDD